MILFAYVLSITTQRIYLHTSIKVWGVYIETHRLCFLSCYRCFLFKRTKGNFGGQLFLSSWLTLVR